MSGQDNGRWVDVGAGLVVAAGAVGVGAAAAAVWMPALAVLSVVALAAVWWLVRRRRAAACATGNTGPVDLGMPSLRAGGRGQGSRVTATWRSR